MNFDSARKERAEAEAATRDERVFTIGGQDFYWKPGVRPEALSDLAKIKPGKRDKDGELIKDKNGDPVDAGTPMNETIEIIDRIIVAMIDPADDAHARWREVRAVEDDPITLDDMQTLVQWLIEQQTGRTPTVPRSPSGGGRGTEKTETSSTDDSSTSGTPEE